MAQIKNTSTQSKRIRAFSRSRRDEEKEELQRAILQTAADLFTEVGYQGFSMRQVAERLRYTVGTLYHYYTNKDDLLLAVIEDAFLRLDRDMDIAFHTTIEPLERLHALALAYVQFGLTHPAAYQLLFLERPDFLLRTQQEEPDTEIVAYRFVYDAIQRALQAEVVRPGDARAYADAFWGQLHGILTLHLRMPNFFDALRTQAALVSAVNIWLEGVRQS